MIPIPASLTYIKNTSIRYMWVSIYNIHFLLVAGFIHGYPRVWIFLTSLVMWSYGHMDLDVFSLHVDLNNIISAKSIFRRLDY